MSTGKWDCVILREICDLVNYGYTTGAKPEPIGPKFLRITDIVPDRIDWSSVPYCKLNEKDLGKYQLEKGDIVIARTGATTGYAKRIRDDYTAVFASYLVRIRVNPKYDSQYVGFVVESDEYKAFIQLNLGGTAQPQANAQVLTSFPIPLPPLPTQRKIAAVLSAYDDLIENNTRRIKILEEMARAIYREWFVEFHFPGHEGVQMIESELGLIPQGWEVVTASQAISINPTASVPRHTEKPFVPMKSATEHSMLITDVEQRTSNSGAKFKNYDTLFARITPCLENGRTGFVQFLSSNDIIALGSTEFIVLRSKTLNPYFVYLLAQTHDFRDNAIKSMTGATGKTTCC